MKRDALLKILRKKIRIEFDTNSDAAKFFGIDESALSRTLSNQRATIPQSILNWSGYELAEESYARVKK